MAARRRRSAAQTKAHREFVSEAEEILERMRDELSELAEGAQQGAETDPEVVNRLFRSAHSLKGLSGMFGLEGMSDLAHHLEDVLDRLRMGRAVLDKQGLGLFDEAVNLIADTLGALGSAQSRASSEEAIAGLLSRIDAWTHQPEPESGELDGLALDPSLLRALTEYEEHRLRENLRRGRRIQVVEACFEILAFEEGLAEITTAIREVGEVLSTLPSPGDAPESQIRFSLLCATDQEPAALARRLGLEPAAAREVGGGGALQGSQAAPQPPATPSDEALADPAAGEPVPAEAVELDSPELGGFERPSLKSISDTVRVDIRKLDELMNLVGELAIQRAALAGLATRLLGEATSARAGKDLEKLHKGLERKLQELQSAVLEVRMVPLRQVFDKLSRVVRRLRLDLDKEVRLEIAGADTELDKLIVEELVDPLMHVVRNAFDHAIEPAEERVAAGKPAVGTIRIEAYQRGNDVVIAVADDGRGIDPEAVHARALERGLVSAGAELSRREKLDLVFAAGLSTRAEVTETSGRGVGMDVVRSNIASLGGIVDLESQEGRGTTIQMTLPITLAIIQALLVGVAGQRFAIPLNSVRETLLVEPADIQRSHGKELLNLRGEALPLRRLAEDFQLGEVDREAKHYAVVLGLGDARMGLLVDSLEGQQDTVIKPIQGPVRRVRGIAGATELGDQGALLVLDVSALVEDSMRGREAS